MLSRRALAPVGSKFQRLSAQFIDAVNAQRVPLRVARLGLTR